ncbi:hypothetical protein THRCLA_08553, partial [Thraustotheca clavata]
FIIKFTMTTEAKQVTKTTTLSKKDKRVKVYLRIRPLVESELERNDTELLLEQPQSSVLNLTTPPTPNDEIEFVEILDGIMVPKSKPKRTRTFTNLSGVFREETTNEQIYDNVVAPLVQETFNGRTACCFAYGHTGSGKTHTILGYENDIGLYRRATAELFELIQKEDMGDLLYIQVRFNEIYNGEVYDLLNDRAKCFVREDGDGKVHIRSATTLSDEGHVQTTSSTIRTASNQEELIAIVNSGLEARRTGHSNVHLASSRSHAVLELEIVSKYLLDLRQARQQANAATTSVGHERDSLKMEIFVRQHEKVEGKWVRKPNAKGSTQDEVDLLEDMVKQLKSMKRQNEEMDKELKDLLGKFTTLGGALVFVDLAGSEYAGSATDGIVKTETEQNECREINKSLSALQACFRAQAKNLAHSSTYRSSKLTMVLRDHLQSTGSTTRMIATLSPSSVYASQTIQTLRYAQMVGQATIFIIIQLPMRQSKSLKRVQVYVRVRPLVASEVNDSLLILDEPSINELKVTTPPSELDDIHFVEVLDGMKVPKSKPVKSRTFRGLSGKFFEDINNAQVYDTVMAPLIKETVCGRTGCCFAYGHTGSGKTHTILGTDSEIGLYRLASMDLFVAVKSSNQQIVDHIDKLHVQVRFNEIYNGEVYDLLNEREKCFVREDELGKVHIRSATTKSDDGLVYTSSSTVMRAANHEELIDIVNQGIQARKVGHSNVHLASSRSHAVLEIEIVTDRLLALRNELEEMQAQTTAIGHKRDTLDMSIFLRQHEQIEGKWTARQDAVPTTPEESQMLEDLGAELLQMQEAMQIKLASLNAMQGKHGCAGGALVFVDLAGSEHAGSAKDGIVKTETEQNECREINKSLSALQGCFRAQAKNLGSSTTYRSSKLTMVLRDHLRSAGSTTCMIATLSPSSAFTSQTIQTLQYAQMSA